MTQKLILTELTIERLREHAYKKGKSKEWFDAWLEECVEQLEPVPDGIEVAGLHVPTIGLFGIRNMKWGVKRKNE